MKTFLRDTINYLDLFSWFFVFVFFCGSALIFDGSLALAAAGATAIIIEMLFIAIAVEIIIESLKNKKGIGTLTGFITNGPEAVCLIVGLAVGDIIFAASTPLGSNFINPLLLLVAALLSGQLLTLFRCHRGYSLFTIFGTASLAGSFFLLKTPHYPYWLFSALALTLPLFYLRPEEQKRQEEAFTFSPALWLLPAVILLTAAGYFLDPVVSFTAHHSRVPKGVIGFIVLSTLTSWPEFKSCLALLKRKQLVGAILNITVSNITNIWLAAIGVAAYYFGGQ
ncbi:MAG: sodium:proton exchanger [Deltaproteobacteria bacterium]|nr:MAG: sodium:proton exchanger [Deltaproteobacteria bacterium]